MLYSSNKILIVWWLIPLQIIVISMGQKGGMHGQLGVPVILSTGWRATSRLWNGRAIPPGWSLPFEEILSYTLKLSMFWRRYAFSGSSLGTKNPESLCLWVYGRIFKIYHSGNFYPLKRGTWEADFEISSDVYDRMWPPCETKGLTASSNFSSPSLCLLTIADS